MGMKYNNLLLFFFFQFSFLFFVQFFSFTFVRVKEMIETKFTFAGVILFSQVFKLVD